MGAVIFVATIASSAALFAQTNATNALLKLTPPYGELPPTFWEQNSTAISLAGLGGTALVAFGLGLLFRSKPKAIIPPEVLARETLQQLRAQPEDGAVLSRISQVTRHYFITGFQLAAGELTTTEFNRELMRSQKISSELSAAATEFLRDCDARKFSPTAGSEKMGAADRALSLIDQAEQRRAQLRPPAAMQTSGPRA